ncbi:nuclear transport factor 2 family protein [Phenylobacterium conjunctum]|uniref:Nuclear transport factor 2 family protein n=1 Tax=Phenylobacterium conjunctum TaxID=1298959 RepID=A0ABW3T347_9CAUL
MTAAEIQALADRFFSAIEAGDIAAVGDCYADDVVIWHNDDKLETDKAANLKVLGGFIRIAPKRSYSDRRMILMENGFVQQHVLIAERADGRRLELPACLVIQVANGRITRLDEYLDSATVKAWSLAT